MLSAIVYILLIVFVLIGIVASIYIIMMLALRPKAVGRFVVVIPPGATEADVASLLCAARLRMGLMGDISRGDIIALDCGMKEHCRLQCEALCRELDHTKLLRPEDLPRELSWEHCLPRIGNADEST